MKEGHAGTQSPGYTREMTVEQLERCNETMSLIGYVGLPGGFGEPPRWGLGGNVAWAEAQRQAALDRMVMRGGFVNEGDARSRGEWW